MRPQLRSSRSFRACALSALTFVLLTCGASVLAPGLARASTDAGPIAVIVPDPGNLQLLAFWTALGAGYFRDEGLDVRVVPAEKPALAESMFQSGAAPAAVLPGPSYERLIAAQFPFLLTANLLTNDPLDLVVRRDLAQRVHFSRGMSLRRRLDLLQGVPIGVSAQARPRLNVLFRTQGLDVNTVRVILLGPEEQIAALEAHQVDALYTQSPELEKALLDQDLVMAIDQSGGDVPQFGERMIQALAVTRAFEGAHPGSAAAMARAISKAEHLLRFDRDAAAEAVLRALPQADRRQALYLLSIYAAAVPATPHVEEALVTREIRFYPVGGDPLRLDGIALRDFIFDDGGPSSIGVSPPPGGGGGGGGGSPSSPHRVVLLASLLALAIAVVAVVADQRDRSKSVS